jgi:TrmH family RNA methyltransferase
MPNSMLSEQNARLAAARRLTRRRARREAGLFLAEGAQAVREALRSGVVVELFATADAIARNVDLLAGHDVSEISDRSAAALSETVTPQGLIAVCRVESRTVDDVLVGSPKLIVVVVEPNDPGNLGTIVRTADAAGADAVVVDAGVDPHNGKAVRASAGSVFHLPIVECATDELLAGARPVGMTVLAATGHGDVDLDQLGDDGTLARPTVWLFGSEAHGLRTSALDAADHAVRVPVYGQAESLNLSAAAAVCLYASARAQRR